MKSKFLRMVSVVMLSAFLAVTAVVSPAAAAPNAEKAECKHPTLYLANIKRIFINADTNSHQAADLYIYECEICKEQPTDFRKTIIVGTFRHSYGSDGVCNECRYRYP